MYPEHWDNIAFIIKSLIRHCLGGSELRSLLSNTLFVGSYVVDTLRIDYGDDGMIGSRSTKTVIFQLWVIKS